MHIYPVCTHMCRKAKWWQTDTKYTDLKAIYVFPNDSAFTYSLECVFCLSHWYHSQLFDICFLIPSSYDIPFSLSYFTYIIIFISLQSLYSSFLLVDLYLYFSLSLSLSLSLSVFFLNLLLLLLLPPLFCLSLSLFLSLSLSLYILFLDTSTRNTMLVPLRKVRESWMTSNSKADRTLNSCQHYLRTSLNFL